MRHLNINDFSAEFAVRLNRFFDARANVRVNALAEKLARDAYARATDVARQLRGVVGHGHVGGRRVAVVAPRDCS